MNDKILVIVQLAGGNDGLNTVIPVADPLYHSLRGPLAIKSNLDIGNGWALHPSLVNVHKLFHQKKVSIVHGVGEVSMDHSHFSCIAKWQSGSNSDTTSSAGWLGRFLDSINAPLESAIAPPTSLLPLHIFRDKTDTIVIPERATLLGQDQNRVTKAIGNFKGSTAPASFIAFSTSTAIKVGSNLSKKIASTYPTTVQNKFVTAAQLINADPKLKIVAIDQDGYDTHANQLSTHKDLLSSLDTAIGDFYNTLNPQHHSKVLIVTFSEFGRRVVPNASNGTDHGAGSNLFIIGDDAAGGHFGFTPNLVQKQAPSFPNEVYINENGNLSVGLDYRHVYSSILTWLGSSDPSSILGADYKPVPAIKNIGSPETPDFSEILDLLAAMRISCTRSLINLQRIESLHLSPQIVSVRSSLENNRKAIQAALKFYKNLNNT